MTKTTTRVALAGAALASLLLAACGDDDSSDAGAGTTAAPDTVAPATTAAASLEAYVAAMTPLCEEFDTAANAATAPVFAAEGPPDGALAQQALTDIGTAIGTFVTAAGQVPAPTEAAGILSAYEQIAGEVATASASPDAAVAFLDGDDPRAEVAITADSIGLPACGTGGAFALMNEVALSAAPADAIAIEAFDYGWKGLPATLPAGEVSFTFTNGAEQDHEMAIVPLAPGADPDEVLTKVQTATSEEFDALFGEIAAGPPAGLYAGPGGAAAGTTELQPGTYAVLCFIPAADGAPHTQKGMAVVVDVT